MPFVSFCLVPFWMRYESFLYGHQNIWTSGTPYWPGRSNEFLLPPTALRFHKRTGARNIGMFRHVFNSNRHLSYVSPTSLCVRVCTVRTATIEAPLAGNRDIFVDQLAPPRFSPPPRSSVGAAWGIKEISASCYSHGIFYEIKDPTVQLFRKLTPRPARFYHPPHSLPRLGRLENQNIPQ